jgi:NitT/TauT family transport system substrate-binding protein
MRPSMKIGVLPNEDSLPLFVAEKDGLFKKAGLDVTLVQFPSAAERDAALTAGSIDAASGDIIAAALLTSKGFPVRMVTLELGATPKQGRFGILAAKNSGLTSLRDLSTKGALAQSSGTLATYSADKMLEQASVDPKSVKRVEVKKLPVRFELLSQGKVPAAVLPEPLLSLGVKQGLKLLADDTTGANISQTVLYVSDKYLETPGGAASAKALLGVWDEAVKSINAAPDSYRALLVDKARLPKPIATEYEINQYPEAQLPTTAMVAEVLQWMTGNKLLGTPVTYDQLVWQPK